MTESTASPAYDEHWDAAILFSLRDGYVWATWPDTEAAVKLGRHEMVSEMMRDFLAQDAVGERLAVRAERGASAQPSG